MTEREIFDAALAIADPASRTAYLEDACRGNAALRDHLAGLLAAHLKLGSFLELPGANVCLTIDQPALEKPGTQIGPYKLLQQIGEGGMGVVYMAEQSEPVKRRVALKIIKPGMDTRQVIARFEAERQALSLMDHPNIAKVLDAGTTDSGRPYFVMELVKGQPITQYCDERHLTLRQRLELLIPVCQAIQHAHQKGIIHRDIKPTNILVAEYDEQPVPKVIDFGVAKATSQALTEKTMFTVLGQIVGTLEYMSPEQAKVNQLDIDTRSDIYSLGVLLYELLTGSTPFDRKRLHSAAFDEMLRIIREEEPPKPSTRLSDLSTPQMSSAHSVSGHAGSRSEPATLASIAAQRQTEPAKLTKLVRGELDWIVMKALEKDRNRRYETANGFAQDVQRYLADEPVQACPPSAAYRLRKFSRRNRLKLVAAAVLATALLVAIGSVGWAVRDRAARQADVDRAKSERLARASSTLQQILMETDRLMADQKWPEALAVARRAGATVAGSEADEATAERVRGLLKDLEFIDRLEKIRMQRATSADGKFDFAKADRDYAQAFRDHGVDVLELAVETSIDRLKAHPAFAVPLAAALDDWVYARPIVSAGDTAGWRRLVAVARGIDPEPLRDQLRATLGRPVSAVQDDLRRLADSIDIRAQHPATVVCLAYSLQHVNQQDSAVRLLRKAQAVSPGDFWLNLELGIALKHQKDHEGAVRFYTAAVSIRPNSAAAQNNLGSGLRSQKKLDEAIACFWKAIELDRNFAMAHGNLGFALHEQKKLDEAVAASRKAIELDPNLFIGYIALGAALADQKKLDEAVAACRKAVEVAPKSAYAYVALSDALRDQKKLDEALAACRKAVELDPNYDGAYISLGNALSEQKKTDEAIAAFRKAIELDPKSAVAYANLGVALSGQKPDEALAACRKAIELDPQYAIAHNALGTALFALKKLDEAVAAFRRSIELDPTTAPFLANLGAALYHQKKLDDAGAAFRKAIELDPTDANFHGNLGNVLRDQKKLDEAVAAFRKVVELEPNDTRAYVTLGSCLLELGKLDEAVAAYRKFVELQPNSAAAYLLLGHALSRHKKLDEAVAAFRKTVELEPNNATHYFLLGFALHNQRKFDEAAESYRKTIELNPRFPTVHGALGDAFFLQEKYDEAAAAYRRAVEVDPKFADAYFGLGRALHGLKKLDEAIAAYRNALEINPTLAAARHYLDLALSEQKAGVEKKKD